MSLVVNTNIRLGFLWNLLYSTHLKNRFKVLHGSHVFSVIQNELNYTEKIWALSPGSADLVIELPRVILVAWLKLRSLLRHIWKWYVVTQQDGDGHWLHLSHLPLYNSPPRQIDGEMNSDEPKPRLFAARECPAMAVCLAGCNTSEIQLQWNRSGKTQSWNTLRWKMDLECISLTRAVRWGRGTNSVRTHSLEIHITLTLA